MRMQGSRPTTSSQLVGKPTSEGWKVIVVTGDRDAFQLIDDHTTVIYTRRGISDTVMADEGWIRRALRDRPDQYLDYAALRGDSSDNLPGVPGVGEKTATKLIADHGTSRASTGTRRADPANEGEPRRAPRPGVPQPEI